MYEQATNPQIATPVLMVFKQLPEGLYFQNV